VKKKEYAVNVLAIIVKEMSYLLVFFQMMLKRRIIGQLRILLELIKANKKRKIKKKIC
jgi:hypothetical protein